MTTAYLLVSAYLILLTIAATTARAADPPKGSAIAAEIVATWQCQDLLYPGVPAYRRHTPVYYDPWKMTKHHSKAFVVAQLNKWELRHRRCNAKLQEKKRQWNWQAWLPDKWQRIGACETGYGQRPGNWFHNSGTHQGAFGFANASWDDFKLPGYPDEAYQATPWQQYQVALAIHARYGFSGWGCRNA